MSAGGQMSHADYAALLRFRTTLRHFLRWSEQRAAELGLTAAQHQLLLAVKGHGDPLGPTIGEAAGYLALRHHSAVELADRAQRAGLVERCPDAADHRVIRLRLTDAGERLIAALSRAHLDELQRIGALFSDEGGAVPAVAKTPQPPTRSKR